MSTETVPKGYKRTEVGVIPEDWEVKPFQSVANIERGKFTARPRNDPKYYGGNIPFIQTGDVANSNGQIRTFTQTLNEDGLRVSKLFARGTIFFTIAANIGDIGFASFDAACPDSLVAITVKDGIYSDWLANELKSRKSAFENLATHNAQLNINLEKLRPYLLPVPTPAEQQAIAAALSDADALIESLEQLLAKKRQIKQGAMQELLTGKRRLPGFAGKWETRELGCLFEITSSKRVFQSEWRTEGIPFYRTRELAILAERGSVENELFITQELYQTHKSSYGVPKDGDLLVTGVGTLGKVLVVRNENAFYFKDGNIIWLKNQGKVDSEFLNQLYQTPIIIRQIEESSTGTTVGTYTITSANKTSIPYPPHPEQSAIASVLSDMDAELEVLEGKLKKARQVKQGMMQKLLTGKVRLV